MVKPDISEVSRIQRCFVVWLVIDVSHNPLLVAAKNTSARPSSSAILGDDLFSAIGGPYCLLLQDRRATYREDYLYICPSYLPSLFTSSMTISTRKFLAASMLWRTLTRTVASSSFALTDSEGSSALITGVLLVCRNYTHQRQTETFTHSMFLDNQSLWFFCSSILRDRVTE